MTAFCKHVFASINFKYTRRALTHTHTHPPHATKPTLTSPSRPQMCVEGAHFISCWGKCWLTFQVVGSTVIPWMGREARGRDILADSSPCRVTRGLGPLQRGLLWRIPGTWGRDCFVCLDHARPGSPRLCEMSAALKLAVCSEWQGFCPG